MKEARDVNQGAEEGTEFLPQKEGLSRLYRFLLGSGSETDNYLRGLISDTDEQTLSHVNLNWDALRPFVLNLTDEKKNKRSVNRLGYRFYLGTINGNRNFYLSLYIPSRFGSLKQVCVNPRHLDCGEKPYFWLDFEAPTQIGSELGGEIIASARLKPEEGTNKVDFKRWHGIGEELLADYLFGANGIKPQDLVPFEVENTTETGLASYRIAARKGLEVHLYENPSVKRGDVLRFMPGADAEGFYQWLDVVKVDRNLPTEEWQVVASYRLLPDEYRLQAFNWLGVNRQLLSDYLKGVGNIKFEDLRPIVTTVAMRNLNYINVIASLSHNLEIPFYFPKGSLAVGDSVVIFPRQDEKGYYQWLELYKADSESGEPVGDAIAFGRLLGGEFLQKGWNGYEIEMLKDFAEGERTFDDLVPIKMHVGDNPMINLWRDGRRKVYFVPSRIFGVSKGDDLLLIPQGQEEGAINFVLKREDVTLGRYRFDIENRTFNLIEIIHQAGEGYFDEKTGLYTDVNGLTWVSAWRLSQEYKMTPNVVYRLLSGVTSMSYQFQRKMTLYKEDEAKEVIANYQKQNLRAVAEGEIVANEDSDKYLRELITGKEEK